MMDKESWWSPVRRRTVFSTVLLAVASLLGMPFSGPLFADTISPTNANIRYVGRFDTSNPVVPRMYWSGTHIIAWVEGTSCQVKLNCAEGDDFFNIMIDNGTPVKHALTAGSQTITAASGLEEGIHKIEIFKRTSYQKDNTAFEGFITDEGKGLALLPPAPAVKIQFYGDSITDGHSVDAPSDNDASTYWNNYRTYAALTARNLNMEYVCIAASGIAVIHPWSPGFIMNNYYDRIVPGDSSPSNAWDFSKYVPDIVVISLFQNDSWTQPSPHSALEQEEIISAYEDFLVKIRAKHPESEIICALGNMDAVSTGSVWPGYIDSAVARMNGLRNDSKVYSLFFPYKGSGGHPLAAEQVLMADVLTAFIQNNFDYLFTRDAAQGADLTALNAELNKTWPNNHTISIIFHGHSVPSGYHAAGVVKPFESSPHLFRVMLQERYPNAVINVVTTSIGGEAAIARFDEDVYRYDTIILCRAT